MRFASLEMFWPPHTLRVIKLAAAEAYTNFQAKLAKSMAYYCTSYTDRRHYLVIDRYRPPAAIDDFSLSSKWFWLNFHIKLHERSRQARNWL
jgi:hypothetical protein